MLSRMFDFPVLGSPMKIFSRLQPSFRLLIDLKFFISRELNIIGSFRACIAWRVWTVIFAGKWESTDNYYKPTPKNYSSYRGCQPGPAHVVMVSGVIRMRARGVALVSS